MVGYPVLLVTRLLTLSPRFAMLFALVYFYPTFLAESGHSVAVRPPIGPQPPMV